jgi:type II secretory pathway pseudopilin PulG
MTRLRSSAGFVLTEMIIVLSVSLILLGATLVTFDNFVRDSQDNDKRQDKVELARSTLDHQSRQLRNLAKRITNTAVIDTVAPYDFIFQTSDPSRTWVRYCLNTSLGTDKGRLYEQTQKLAPSAAGSPVSAAMRSGCPSNSGWSTARVVGDSVTNKIGGRDRPVFAFRCSDNTNTADGNATCNTPAGYDRIVGVENSLFVNTTPKRLAEELKVNSAVYLRNQNQAPVASFTITRMASPARTVLLNASASTDFENRTLQFFWFLGTMPATANIRCDQASETNVSSGTLWGGNLVGRGIAYQYTWKQLTPASGTAQNFGVVACDPGDRFSFAGPQSVNIP